MFPRKVLSSFLLPPDLPDEPSCYRDAKRSAQHQCRFSASVSLKSIPAAGELRKRGFRLRLREQPLRLLLTLLSVAGRVVTHEKPTGALARRDVRGVRPGDQQGRQRAAGGLEDCRRAPASLKRCRNAATVLSVQSRKFELRTQPSTRKDFDRDGDGWRTSPGGISGIEGRSPICIRASVYLSKPWIPKVMVGLPMGLADANVILGIWGLRQPETAFGAARTAATRAIELNPNLAEAHTSLAEVLTGYEWDWCEAERHYRHALSLNAGYATAHHWYAQLLVSLGRYAEAVSHIELARRADPVSPAINA